MNALTSSPEDWRSRYGFDQGPSPQSQAYWKLNSDNANAVSHGVNNMPFVLNPMSLAGQTPEQNKANMYGAATPQQGADPMGSKMGGMMAPQAGQGAGDPLQQILGLIQQNPDIMPLLLQQMQGQPQVMGA